MIKIIVSTALLVLSITGCTTVPVSVNMPKDHPALNVNTQNAKYPLKVALVISDAFSSSTVKSSTSFPNIDYIFQYDLGNDFSETLPEFFNNRFEKVTVIQSAENAGQFDYVFIPNISSSRLSTSAEATKLVPTYALEINLELVTNKSGSVHASTRIKEAIERDTELACWACWGEKILNQQKIRDEYAQLLTRVYSRLDSYLNSVLMESKSAK